MGFMTDGSITTDSGKVKFVFKKGDKIISSISVSSEESLNFENNISSRLKQLSSEYSCSESDIQWSKKELI